MYTNYGSSAVSIADRESVSDEAARVREIYAERKGSIDAFPIDPFWKKLTPKVDDDYETHYRHGGFDVYPEYNRQPMANDPRAYKDWVVRLTEKGYREIAPACEHLLKMGEKIRSFMESQLDTTKQKTQRMIAIILNDADRLFANVYNRRHFEAQSQRIVLNDDKTFQRLTDWLLYTPPTLDKTKKTTQKLGSYTYNPRRRTRRIR